LSPNTATPAAQHGGGADGGLVKWAPVVAPKNAGAEKRARAAAARTALAPEVGGAHELLGIEVAPLFHVHPRGAGLLGEGRCAQPDHGLAIRGAAHRAHRHLFSLHSYVQLFDLA
jgi:hypothetical protein